MQWRNYKMCYSETLSKFQQNLVQSILWWRVFMFALVKGHDLLQKGAKKASFGKVNLGLFKRMTTLFSKGKY